VKNVNVRVHSLVLFSLEFGTHTRLANATFSLVEVDVSIHDDGVMVRGRISTKAGVQCSSGEENGRIGPREVK
jgi:hypothetical protein